MDLHRGDPILRAKVDYKLGYYQKLRDQLLITAATDLITIGTPATSEAGAVDRGIAPALRTCIVNRSTLLKDLDAKVAALMEQLEDLVIH